MAYADFLNDCRTTINVAAEEKTKLATFHLLVLQNAAMLETQNPAVFCEAVGVPKGFVAEFTQMLALHRLMRKRKVWLAQA
jgi:hypothetical protein